MAKKEEPIKVRPSEAIRILSGYNEAVVLLVQTAELAVNHKLVDSKISDQLSENIDRVKKFYIEV